MSRISSSEVSNSFDNDIDLLVKFPSKPRIIKELVTFPYDSESLLVTGTASRKLLSGSYCKLLLQEIWPKLDGFSEVEELRSTLNIQHNLDEILALLHRSGLLENGNMPAVENFPNQVDSFLGRHVSAAGHLDSRESAAVQIRDAVVVVLASDINTFEIIERLLCSGFRTVLDGRNVNYESCDPTIFLVIGDNTGFRQYTSKIPQTSHAIILFSQLTNDSLAIGPLYLPEYSPCIECSIRAIEGNFQIGDTSQLGFFREIIVQHLIGAVGKIEQHSLFSVFVTHAEIDGQWNQDKVTICRTPGCMGCNLDGFSSLIKGSDEANVWKVLNSTMLPPRQLMSKRAHEGHYSSENVALITQQDELIDGKVISLELKAEDFVAKVSEGQEIPPLTQLQHVGLVLQMSYGFSSVKDGNTSYSKKIAPTGGNLRSPEAYIYFQDVQGLDNGLYRYNSKNHTLHLVDDQVDKFLLESSIGMEISGSCSIVIGVASLKKMWSKYKVFSLRLSQFDAGVALSYVHDTSWALGVSTYECTDFRSKLLLKLLQLPTSRRYYDISSVVLLNFDAQQEYQLELHAKRAQESNFSESLGRSLTKSINCSIDPVTRWIQKSGNLFYNYFTNAIGRAATREFNRNWISFDNCLSMVNSMHMRNSVLLDCGANECFYSILVVNNVGHPTFPAGLYTSNKVDDLKLHQPVNDISEIAECFNQKSLGTAPIIFIYTTNMNMLFKYHGSAGIQSALMRAASLLMHCWFVGRELGIDGCFSGGLIESEFRTRMDLDGYTMFPLFAYAAGQKIKMY